MVVLVVILLPPRNYDTSTATVIDVGLLNIVSEVSMVSKHHFFDMSKVQTSKHRVFDIYRNTIMMQYFERKYRILSSIFFCVLALHPCVDDADTERNVFVYDIDYAHQYRYRIDEHILI